MSGLQEGDTLLLDGENAELFVRLRSFYGMDGTNLKRMERQQIFMQAFLQTIKNKMSESPAFLIGLYNEVKPYLATDMGLRELLYAGRFGMAGMQDITVHSMGGHSEEGVVEGDVWENVFVPDEDWIQEYLAEVQFTPAE